MQFAQHGRTQSAWTSFHIICIILYDQKHTFEQNAVTLHCRCTTSTTAPSQHSVLVGVQFDLRQMFIFTLSALTEIHEITSLIL